MLPIGITFNAGNGIKKNYEKEWGRDYRTSFALMVMARCASALYDIDLGKMCQLIRINLRTLDISPGIGTAGYHLIDMFLRYVVSYERKRGMPIDDVVIIVDEVMTAEAKLKEFYKNFDEACTVLRVWVLNSKREPFTFNTVLCISSLKLSALGDTSGRATSSLRIHRHCILPVL